MRTEENRNEACPHGMWKCGSGLGFKADGALDISWSRSAQNLLLDSVSQARTDSSVDRSSQHMVILLEKRIERVGIWEPLTQTERSGKHIKRYL